MSRIVYDIMFNTSVGNTPTWMDLTTSTAYIEQGEDWFTFHAYSSSCCTISMHRSRRYEGHADNGRTAVSG